MPRQTNTHQQADTALHPCFLHMNRMSSDTDPEPEPRGEYGAYYIGELVTRTIRHGLALDPDDAVSAQDRLKFALIEGTHELYDSRSRGHFDHMLEVARIVDQYFLQGWLTRIRRHPSGARLSHLRIDIRDGNENCEDSCSGFRVGPRDDNIASPPVVDVDIDSAGRWTVAQIVGLLIHEMVHGYLALFSCRGGSSYEYGSCSRRSHDRRCRHGCYPRMLMRHIFETIREWDDALGYFGEDFIERCDQEGRDDALLCIRSLWCL